MGKKIKKGVLQYFETETGERLGIGFYCPGCGEVHMINSTWIFNENFDNPTFSPSVLITSGHYCSHYDKDRDNCWCKYYEEHPDKVKLFKCGICHSFITNGEIKYLDDCTHELAGKTVRLEVVPDDIE